MTPESKVLAIYGASGLGREVLELSQVINAANYRWSQIVFIDDGDVPSQVNSHDVYGYDEALERFGNSLEVVMGIGEPSTREMLFKKLENDHIPLSTLVHPEVHVPDTTSVGTGSVIQYGCFISCNVTISNHVYLQPHCNVGHDVYLGKGCVVSGFVNLAGAVRVGECTYIGMSSAIKELVTVGKNTIIGMGSMVHKDVPDGVIAMGNPARVIAKNEEKRVFKH